MACSPHTSLLDSIIFSKETALSAVTGRQKPQSNTAKQIRTKFFIVDRIVRILTPTNKRLKIDSSHITANIKPVVLISKQEGIARFFPLFRPFQVWKWADLAVILKAK